MPAAAAPAVPPARAQVPLCASGPKTLMRTPDRWVAPGGGPHTPPSCSPAPIGSVPRPLAMTQGFWGLYKARVLQALGEEVIWGGGGTGRQSPPATPCPHREGVSLQGDPPELMEAAEPPVPAEEGPGPVAQLARKVRMRRGC